MAKLCRAYRFATSASSSKEVSGATYEPRSLATLAVRQPLPAGYLVSAALGLLATMAALAGASPFASAT